MIELLVVIVIMVILISIVGVASSSLINQSRASNTKAVLQVVSDAIQEFKREKPAILKVAGRRPTEPIEKQRAVYAERYGQYPPDELEVFTDGSGIPGTTIKKSLAPGGAIMHPGGPYNQMLFYTLGNPTPELEHRDLAAMIVAIETLTESAASILDKIPDGNRTAGALKADGSPAQFLDRNNDGVFDADDHQIRYIVDSWGVPLSYMAQRDWAKPTEGATLSQNHLKWNEASTEMIRLTGGEPLIFSYGPDGKEQLTQDAMLNDEAAASLVGDFEKNDGDRLTNPMNADNVYSQDGIKEKLSEARQ